MVLYSGGIGTASGSAGLVLVRTLLDGQPHPQLQHHALCMLMYCNMVHRTAAVFR